MQPARACLQPFLRTAAQAVRSVSPQTFNNCRFTTLTPLKIYYVLGRPGSVGDLLRMEIQRRREGTANVYEHVDEIERTLAAGGIVPGFMSATLLHRYITRVQEQHGSSAILVDGFPRTMDNVHEAEKRFDNTAVSLIHIDCPADVVLARLLQRGRADDVPHILEQRLRDFEEKTVPVIEHFRSRGLLSEIDGRGSVEEVFHRVRQLMPFRTI